MNPITFEQSNRIIRKPTPQYLHLPDIPVHVDQDGCFTSCWQLSWAERLRLLFTGKLWLTLLTFNTKVQPCRPTTVCPLVTVTFAPGPTGAHIEDA